MQHSTQLISSTFRDAISVRKLTEPLTLHSDRGTQYTARTFHMLLKKNNVVQSLSAPGKPHDNAVMESFFSTFKREELYRSEADLRQQITSYIAFFNQKRPHEQLNYKTPDQVKDMFSCSTPNV